MSIPASGGPAAFHQAQIGSINGGTFNTVTQFINNQTGGEARTVHGTIAKLEELAGPSKASEFVKIHNGIMDIKTKGTGLTFRSKSQVQQWEKGELDVLWINGGPGAGKTYMATSFYEWAQERAAKEPPGTTAVVHVYMRYDQKLTDYCVVLAVLVQLLWFSKELPNVLSKVDRAIEEWYRSKSKPALNQLVALFKDIVKEFRSVDIILDGMDEMLREFQYLLVETFADIGAQLVFLSRPSELLESAAREEFERCGRSFAVLELVAADEDLDLFINATIHRTLPLRRALANKEKRNHVSTRIRVGAHGMFLHAALQMERLKSCHTILAINKALDGFPARIEDLYHTTLKRIYDEDDGSLAQRLLGWLLHTRGSITISDLQYAVSVSPETYRLEEDGLLDEGYLLSLCCGLVVVEATTQTARFVHYSAYEVVLSLLQTWFGLGQAADQHEAIVHTCLARLEDCGFQESTLKTLGDLRREFNTHPLLEYAYRNSSFHIRLAAANGPSVEPFVRGSISFPYYPNIEGHDSDRGDLCLLTPIHVAALFGLTSLVSDIITVHQVHVDLRSAHPTGLGWTALMIAAVEGHEDVLDLLLRLGADVNLVNQSGGNALHEPSYMGNAAIVKMLCRVEGVDINHRNQWGNTPLHSSARLGHLSVAKILLSVPHIDPNIIDLYGNTALNKPSLNGHLEIVLALLALPSVDVNLADNWGNTPLHSASSKGDLRLVQALLGHPKIDVDRRTYGGNTPLMTAARCGHLDVLSLLLQHSQTQPNVVDENGNTALSMACLHGHSEVVLALLTVTTIDVNLANKWGDTPLIRASWEGHLRTVQALLGHPQTDVNRQSNYADTPLIVAAREGHAGVLRLLLQNPKTQPNVGDQDGKTALSKAAVNGRLEAVVTLLAVPNVDINLASKHGETPLHLASLKGHIKIVEALLGHGADVNGRTNDGNTPLTIAARRGHAGVLCVLLQHSQAQPNAMDEYGNTALSQAAFNGRLEVVVALLAVTTVDVNLANNLGETPLYLASSKNHVKVVEALLGHPQTDVNRQSDAGNTPVAIAAREGCAGTLLLLLHHGQTQWNIVDEDGNTVLGMASLNGHLEAVLALLAASTIDFNLANKFGETPLHLASAEGHIEVVEALLEHQADVNNQTNDGETALTLALAAEEVDVDIVRLLLAAPDIDVSLVTEVGKTALDYAAECGDEEVVQLLLSHPLAQSKDPVTSR